MQIKVTLSEAEMKAVRDQGETVRDQLLALGFTWADKLIGKIETAMTPAVKAPSKVKSLWAAIARPELKKVLAVATYQFGVPAYWRLDSDTDEACAHCARPLGHARLVPVSAMGEVPRLAHKACSWEFWKANSPHAGHITKTNGDEIVCGESILESYTAEETASTASLARNLAKAA